MRLLACRRGLSDAERVLEKIQLEIKSISSKKSKDEEHWQRGYLSALEGMLVAIKSGDTRYALITRLPTFDRKRIIEARRRFQVESRNQFEGAFDRGFFAAWAEFLRFVEEAQVKDESETLNSYLEEKG
ncbi:MAG: hypothetical protein QXF26_01620 [Candidatus Bathyarchaeia archaeon]